MVSVRRNPAGRGCIRRVATITAALCVATVLVWPAVAYGGRPAEPLRYQPLPSPVYSAAVAASPTPPAPPTSPPPTTGPPTSSPTPTGRDTRPPTTTRTPDEPAASATPATRDPDAAPARPRTESPGGRAREREGSLGRPAVPPALPQGPVGIAERRAPAGNTLPERAPQAGSQPRLDPRRAPPPPERAGRPAAAPATAWSGWQKLLPDRATGAGIFLAGMLTLVFAISGLVVVGFQRRQW
jgi:hypothetical protein